MTNLEYLFHLEHHGIKLGLDNIRTLLRAAGNPHRTFPSVDVAGTNGKGSVVAMVAAVASAAGYRVARFTSPHLIDIAERFTIASETIPHDQLDAQIGFFRRVADAMPIPPTFFEVTTAVAFRWFAQSVVDLAIVEVGMGGRLDSTNVLKPIVAAITTIDYDHMRYLGDTIEQIAFEKAGIIKPRTPVIIGETKTAPRDVLIARARQMRSPISLIGKDFTFATSGTPFRLEFEYHSPGLSIGPTLLGLTGSYQGENAAVAVAVAERLHRSLPRIDRSAIQRGLAEAHWPCRMERVLDDPPVIIDAAHNPAGAQKIAPGLANCITILAMAADKDARGVIDALAPATRLFIFTQFNGTRSTPPEDLANAAGSLPYQIEPSLETALATGMNLATKDSPLLITGSIFTAGQARQILIDRYGASPLRF
ncbi:MAG TPA: folylpolyglutamate synthase/dihydrofolate synthase family protein [Candidatus Bathyarchaeia archaeon]|nr:folylpolyglutamate synthase/dihydrofolate synthase family protein [Candidatus Bathyarchaeia archaeon]